VCVCVMLSYRTIIPMPIPVAVALIPCMVCERDKSITCKVKKKWCGTCFVLVPGLCVSGDVHTYLCTLSRTLSRL
jgi:hypothetical protein